MSIVHLKFYEPSFKKELTYQLPENQHSFTALPTEALMRISQRKDQHAYPIVIFLDEKIIGFFVLDFGEDKLLYSLNPNALLVRSLSINPNYQQKGLGLNAMKEIIPLVKTYFPIVNELVLGVNFNNTSAYQFYKKIGYQDEGNIFVGPKGKQHILTLKF